jgi:hypothetical protein
MKENLEKKLKEYTELSNQYKILSLKYEGAAEAILLLLKELENPSNPEEKS